MTIVFSILRNLLLTFLLWTSQILPGPASRLNPLSPLTKFDVFIVDQQSVCVPFVRLLLGTPVVFYCHFPDKLLSGGWEIGSDSAAGNIDLSRQVKGSNRASLLKRLYRWPIDRLEEITTGEYAERSGLTRQVNQMSFWRTPSSHLVYTRQRFHHSRKGRHESYTPASMSPSTKMSGTARAKEGQKMALTWSLRKSYGCAHVFSS